MRRLNRARLKPQSGVIPVFEGLAPVSSPCPEGSNCGAPVVTPDESMLLFSITKTGVFVPAVQEVALTHSAEENEVTSGTQVIEHPELGERVPAWISDDGCKVIVSKAQSSDLAWAERAPQ